MTTETTYNLAKANTISVHDLPQSTGLGNLNTENVPESEIERDMVEDDNGEWH